MVKRHLRKKATGYFHGYFENIVLFALIQALNYTKVVYYEIIGITGLANSSNVIAHTDVGSYVDLLWVPLACPRQELSPWRIHNNYMHKPVIDICQYSLCGYIKKLSSYQCP